MKKLGISLIFVFLTIANLSAKKYHLTQLEVFNSGHEEMLSGDLMLQVDSNNRIQKAFVDGLPVKVSLSKLDSGGKPLILRVTAFGLHIVDLYSRDFSVSKGGNVNLSFNAEAGVKDNYDLRLRYHKGHKRWLMYNNGRIVTKLVARLNIKPGTSVIKILNSQPLVEHSYLVY